VASCGCEKLGLTPEFGIRERFGFAVLRQTSLCPDRYPRRPEYRRNDRFSLRCRSYSAVSIVLGPMAEAGFELVCEVEPATRPDLKHVRHQIGVLSSIAGTFLIRTTTLVGQPSRVSPLRMK